jgi:hypothetical protein
MCVCVCVYVYVCIYVYIYIYIYRQLVRRRRRGARRPSSMTAKLSNCANSLRQRTTMPRTSGVPYYEGGKR